MPTWKKKKEKKTNKKNRGRLEKLPTTRFVVNLKEEIKLTGNSSGTVDENEDHSTESPSDAENANTAADLAAVFDVGLATVANDGKNSDVQEEESGYELSDDGSVKRPLSELVGVDERSRWRVVVVLGGEPSGIRVLGHG